MSDNIHTTCRPTARVTDIYCTNIIFMIIIHSIIIVSTLQYGKKCNKTKRKCMQQIFLEPIQNVFMKKIFFICLEVAVFYDCHFCQELPVSSHVLFLRWIRGLGAS